MHRFTTKVEVLLILTAVSFLSAVVSNFLTGPMSLWFLAVAILSMIVVAVKVFEL